MAGGKLPAKRFTAFIAVFLSVFSPVLYEAEAQQDRWDPDFTDYLEAVFDPGSGELTEEIYESLMQFHRRPLNLNSATREDLRMLLLLDDQAISRILEHRLEYGSLISIGELYLIEGLDSTDISAIKDLVTVEPVFSIPGDTLSFLKRLKSLGRGSLIGRTGMILEKKRGYLNRDNPVAADQKRYYLGSPVQIGLRFNFEVPDDVAVGLTAEKDAGEKFFFAPEVNGYGFDHYSGFITKHFNSPIRRITVGDFQVQAGQGLVIGNGFFVGKGTEPIRTTVRHDQGARGYQGSTEYGFFRGLALDLGGDRWESTIFISGKGQDATIEALPADPGEPSSDGLPGTQDGFPPAEQHDDDGRKVIRNLQKTGYHRTIQELSKKNAAFILSAGYSGGYRSSNNHLVIGMSGIWTRLNLPIHEKPSWHNTFDFSGSEHLNAGINYNYYRGKFNVFGEIAIAGTRGIGAVQGIIANLGSSVETVIHLRHYDKRYVSFTGRAFGEYADNKNEQGIYWGLKVFPFPGMTVNFYCDLFRSESLRFNTASPAIGDEWMIQMNYVPGRRWNFEIYLQQEDKPGNLPVDHGMEYVVSPGRRTRGRIGFRYEEAEGLLLRLRIQGSSYQDERESETGFTLVQDAGIKFSRGYLKARIAYFNTEGYQARQYVYEPDVLFSYTSSMYYGKGYRYMLLFKYSPSRFIDLWLKFGQYIYPGQDKTGSGLEEIDGNKKSEFRCQLRIKF